MKKLQKAESMQRTFCLCFGSTESIRIPTLSNSRKSVPVSCKRKNICSVRNLSSFFFFLCFLVHFASSS